MAKTKRKYSETGNPDDLVAYDYATSILFKREVLPVNKRYNYYQINMILALDPINVIHIDKVCRLGYKGYNHYHHLMIVVEKRTGVQMRDVQLLQNETKEEKTAKGFLADSLEISKREVEKYINELGVQYLDNFIKEYKEEIKELIKKKKYV